MQNTRQTETRTKLVFTAKLEDKVGGICIAAADLTQATLPAGTPVGLDANGLAHVIKQAVLADDATDSATDYKVDKGHNFKVGDPIASAVSGAAYDITAIDTSNENYDTLTIGTTLGVALSDDDVLFLAAAESASDAALAYTPLGLTGHDIDIVTGSNPVVDCIVRGSVNTLTAPAYNAEVKAALPHFRFE